jgi:hypothetical protein
MRPPQTTNARTKTQLAEMGDLEACLGLVEDGAFPLFAASFLAKRSFARRCWGVCACKMG